MSGLLSVLVSEERGFVAVPADLDKLAIVMGCSSAGSGLSSFFLNGESAIADRGYGDAVDTLCHIIEQPQQSGSSNKFPAAMYSTAIDAAGSYGTIDVSGKSGSSTVSVDPESPPFGTYEAQLTIVAGGTIATDPITLKWSLDGGRNLSRITSLSTATVSTYGSETSSAGSFPVALAVGDTFVGKVDEQGSATTLTIAATAAIYTSSGATYAAVTAGHTITFLVAGVAGDQVVTFTGSEASEGDFIAAINAQVSGMFAQDDSGDIQFVTDVKGSAAAASIVSASPDVLTSLGVSAGAFTNAGPNNVTNVGAVTAAQFAALLTSTFTGGTLGSTGTAIGTDRVKWATNTPGASPKGVQFTSGTGVSKIVGFDTSEHNGAANAYAFTIPNSNVRFLFSSGSLSAGDVIKVRTLAPQPGTSDVDDAFNALAAAPGDFALLVCEFPCDATMAAHITTGLNTLLAVGKRVTALVRTRIRDFEGGESESTWATLVAADLASYDDSRIIARAGYGLITDAMTTRQYLRSTLAQFAADVVRVDRSVWPGAPADQPESMVKLIDATGATVGHDEGPRGAVTGLSDDTLGNRFSCEQRLADPQRREAVFDCVPWTLYAAGERIRNLMTRRVANALEREAVSAGISGLGGKIFYTPANPNVPGSQPMLTPASRNAVHAVIYDVLSVDFADDIQNASAADVDKGLVQVNPVVTVTGGNLIKIAVTLAPLVMGYLLQLSVTLAVQE